MAEGLSATEVAKEMHEHAHHRTRGERIGILEAVLLSIVTLTVAWSGYAAAKWETEATLSLSQSAEKQVKATEQFEAAQTVRAQDISNFNAWFSAYLSDNKAGERVAERRFRPQYDVAFRAWIAEKPFTNPNAPRAPSYMPQYHPVGAAESVRLRTEGDALYAEGSAASHHADDYIRVTLVLASVLFIVGISSQFPLHSVRVGLISVGAVLVVAAAASILRLPPPP